MSILLWFLKEDCDIESIVSEEYTELAQPSKVETLATIAGVYPPF